MPQRDEIRQAALRIIQNSGVDDFKQLVLPTAQHLVGKSKISQSLGDKGRFLLNTGLEHVDPNAIDVGLECLVEALPDGEEKDKVQEILTYWKENIEDILKDNCVVTKMIV